MAKLNEVPAERLWDWHRTERRDEHALELEAASIEQQHWENVGWQQGYGEGLRAGRTVRSLTAGWCVLMGIAIGVVLAAMISWKW